jgi:hypothetical protein
MRLKVELVLEEATDEKKALWELKDALQLYGIKYSIEQSWNINKSA